MSRTTDSDESDDRHLRRRKRRRKEKKNKKEKGRREKKSQKKDCKQKRDSDFRADDDDDTGSVRRQHRKISSQGKRQKTDQFEKRPIQEDERKDTSLEIRESRSNSTAMMSQTSAPEQSSNKYTTRSMAPMSKQEWEAQYNNFRAVIDPATGRTRMMRGTGEIIESIVSRTQHQAINQMATRGDGDSFARSIYREGRRMFHRK